MKTPPHPQAVRLPDWVTRDLLEETIAVWQPYYNGCLTDRDAIEILTSIGLLMDALGDTDDEAVPGAGEGLEP